MRDASVKRLGGDRPPKWQVNVPAKPPGWHPLGAGILTSSATAEAHESCFECTPLIFRGGNNLPRALTMSGSPEFVNAITPLQKLSYHIISYHIVSYHIIWHHVISHHIISYLRGTCRHKSAGECDLQAQWNWTTPSIGEAIKDHSSG